MEINERSNLFFQNLSQKIVQISHLKWDRPQPKIHILGEIRKNHAWHNHSKTLLNTCTMVLTQFLQKRLDLNWYIWTCSGELHLLINLFFSKPKSQEVLWDESRWIIFLSGLSFTAFIGTAYVKCNWTIIILHIF